MSEVFVLSDFVVGLFKKGPVGICIEYLNIIITYKNESKMYLEWFYIKII